MNNWVMIGREIAIPALEQLKQEKPSLAIFIDTYIKRIGEGSIVVWDQSLFGPAPKQD